MDHQRNGTWRASSAKGNRFRPWNSLYSDAVSERAITPLLSLRSKGKFTPRILELRRACDADDTPWLPLQYAFAGGGRMRFELRHTYEPHGVSSLTGRRANRCLGLAQGSVLPQARGWGGDGKGSPEFFLRADRGFRYRPLIDKRPSLAQTTGPSRGSTGWAACAPGAAQCGCSRPAYWGFSAWYTAY